MEAMEALLPFFDNGEDAQLLQLAQGYFAEGNHIKAFEVIEDSITIRGREKIPSTLHFLQGSIFFELANRAESSHMKFAFLLGSVECFEQDFGVNAFSAVALFDISQQLGSVLYYRKTLKNAKDILSFMASYDRLSVMKQNNKSTLENIIQVAESKILLGDTVKKPEAKLKESKEIRDTVKSGSHSAATDKRLRSYWAGMNVESRRKFMRVSIVEFRGYVERLYGKEGQDALEQVLDSAKINRKWKFWMCRTCSQKFLYPKKLKNHLEQEHGAKFKPSTTKHMAQRIDEVWAGMISVAGWEPVDAVAAVEMIKTRLEFMREFVYENGWSNDWPLAADDERSKLLKEIRLLLVSFLERKILSCSLRDWMISFAVKHLAQFEVSEHTLTTECRLAATPQVICFLECHELDQILDLLKKIKCERDDGTDLICRAVDSLWDHTRVKEKIDFDHQFSFMLLDKRLLRGKVASFDDEGTIDVCDHNVHYAKTNPQGDDVITWLLDYPLIDDSFGFPRSIKSYNLDIWVAVLRAIHFTCRNLGTKYSKKLRILSYYAALNDAKNLCIGEDERRSNIPEDQWKTYASLLGDKCEEHLTIDAGDSLDTRLFLCATRDVLEGALHPTFDFPDLEECLDLIHGHKNLINDKVLRSIDLLKSVVPLADSKIFLVEISRISLLNDLSRLSVFDYRSYILQPLKRFLQEKLEGTVDMDAKAKLAEELLSEKKKEKEKKPGSKKKNHKRNKRTSTSMSSLPDQNVEHESSVNLEPGVTVEEDSMEQEVTLSSERGRLEILSSTGNQEEAAKDMQIMPEEDSMSKQLESAHGAAATRCNSALSMTLEVLCNIKVLKEELLHNRHLFPDNLEEHVSCALRNFFTAFVLGQMKEEGDYSHLLSELLTSLEQVCSMSSHAAEVLIAILDFWPCWKSPEIESLVTCLFTLEEYERMSCSKCRRKSNYLEQRYDGIVMAADSIRDLKCAFENIKFEDIFKVFRMEDKMLCNIKRGGCGKANFVHHIITRCPAILTIVLEWEKDETEKEISETTMALEWEIDMSRRYVGLEPNTKYRLVSMVGCAEENEYICLAYKENRWVSFRHETLAKEAVGNWKNVVRFCGERKVRLEILFYEAFQGPNK